jgi:hypothetical protein
MQKPAEGVYPPKLLSELHAVPLNKGAIDKKSHNSSALPRGEISFSVQAVPEAFAIKLIGDSFYFHVAYLL